ncbi:MAG: hypothetical protein ACR2HX_19785 [Pyrinomonadaceae bacterium]
MISTKLISNQSTPADSGVITRHLELAPVANLSAPEPATCRSHIDRVVQQIDSPEVKQIVETVFQDLLRLLECLDLIENYWRQVDVAEQTFALFQLIHDEARRLVGFIRTDAMNSNVLTEELGDTLDGITFAVNHDLQRVFESGPGSSISDKPAQVVVGKLYRAHNILNNCLQQSTITLAMLFDPKLIGARLFNNSDMRYRQSLQLCQDLPEIIKLIEYSEQIGGEPVLTTLIDRLEKFRCESLEYLMYTDWPQFESFCEMIKIPKMQPSELGTVLHQFRCYLETLLGQVRMRDVLACASVGVGKEDNCQMLTTLAENSTSFSGAHNPQNEEIFWRELAFAD